MANHIADLLQHWHSQRDSQQWVLGTVYATEGPSYRKAGAMMLFNDVGQQFGLLSGGCLESDIGRYARQVMVSGKTRTISYDGSDEDDISFQLGIGCGGVVRILLQPISTINDYLALLEVKAALDARSCGIYCQRISDDGDSKAIFAATKPGEIATTFNAQRVLRNRGDGHWLETAIRRSPHLLVFGGGVDARPMVALANMLGWEVSLCDPRPANARREFFMDARTIVRCQPEKLVHETLFESIDAAIVMTHNLALDAAALKVLSHSSVAYLAMLGPLRRKQDVMTLAGITDTDLPVMLSAPAGLDLGAELPEGVALSILAQCHAALAGTKAVALNDPERALLPISPILPISAVSE